MISSMKECVEACFKGECMTNLLKSFKVNPTIITILASTFTERDKDIKGLILAIQCPEKMNLKGLLADRTNMDPETINVFVEIIKNKLR